MKKYVPLSSSFMLTSIVGFLVSMLFVMKISPTWAVTFMIFFIIMFIASIVSMSRIDFDDEVGLKELAIHEKKRK
jgi:4-hydroxybenzoate polyprenyltransferase